jgi:adenosylhomocysteinase
VRKTEGMKKNDHDIADISLSREGEERISWAEMRMPVLNLIKERFKKEKPFNNLRIGCLLHVTAETANLIKTFIAGGAKVSVCAANSHSTQNEVAAALVKNYGVPVFAIKGETADQYDRHVQSVLDFNPNILIDDGADLTVTLHQRLGILDKNLKPVIGWKVKTELKLFGATEETTTGVTRFKALEKSQLLQLPVVAVNDSQTKRFFDNRYGTGQSTMEAIVRTTERLIAGKNITVCGYGWCARGIAARAKGMGAIVTVTEVDPVKALEAAMDGYCVLPAKESVRNADFVITSTGDTDVITTEHFPFMKDGVIIANAGHFYVEFDYYGLKKMSSKFRQVKPFIEEFTLPNGKRIYALGEGRLINLVAANGHPADVMDMSFANQALAAEYLVKEKGKLQSRLYVVPEDLDKSIASLKLQSMGIQIDKLSAKQKKYLSSWE